MSFADFKVISFCYKIFDCVCQDLLPFSPGLKCELS